MGCINSWTLPCFGVHVKSFLDGLPTSSTNLRFDFFCMPSDMCKILDLNKNLIYMRFWRLIWSPLNLICAIKSLLYDTPDDHYNNDNFSIVSLYPIHWSTSRTTSRTQLEHLVGTMKTAEIWEDTYTNITQCALVKHLHTM